MDFYMRHIHFLIWSIQCLIWLKSTQRSHHTHIHTTDRYSHARTIYVSTYTFTLCTYTMYEHDCDANCSIYGTIRCINTFNANSNGPSIWWKTLALTYTHSHSQAWRRSSNRKIQKKSQRMPEREFNNPLIVLC